MSNNEYEWCNNFHGLYCPPEPLKNSPGASSGQHRVFRGGNWYIAALSCAVQMQIYFSPSLGSNNVGFRVAFDEE